ncbi:MAG: hypothetical protein GKS01_04530 [Alphaproteobacteria bacterium]|nr:hypothetical protein [Alphaproteobacteria bacterium]
MADDKETDAFNNPLGPALDGATTLGLDLSYLVPNSADDAEYKIFVAGLPDGVTPSKGKLDSDRNWSLTMAQTTGVTVAVETIGSISNLAEAMTFDVIDISTGERVNRGEVDLNSFSGDRATITIQPVGSEIQENAGGVAEEIVSDDVVLTELDTPIPENISLNRHEQPEEVISQNPDFSGLEEFSEQSPDLDAATALADSDNNIDVSNQAIKPLAETVNTSVTHDFLDSGGQEVTHDDVDDNGGGAVVTNGAPTDISVSGLSVQENSAAGTVVGIASAVDSDSGETFTYSLSDDAGGRFTINPSTGEISVADGASLDYEDAASHGISIQVTDSAGNTYSEAMTVDVADVNEVASDISLSASSVAENSVGATIGTLSKTDSDAGDSHTYSVDDSRFEVVGGQLKLKSGVSLDHEAADSVTVNVTTTDSGGLTRTEAFDISVTDVQEAATDISLSNSSVSENWHDRVVGTLSSTDDEGGSHTYSVDDARFEVVGGQLKLKEGQSLDHETEPTVTMNITSTDAQGNSYTEAMTVNVSDISERPTDMSLSSSSVAENSAGATIGTVTTTDIDDGDTHTYSVDDSRFEVVGGQLKLKSGQSLDYETASSVDVTVVATDSGGRTYTETFTVNVTDVSETGSTLNGTTGNDALTGGTGEDTITGGLGADRMSGGAGDDTLQFNADGTWGSDWYAVNGDTDDWESITGKNQSDDVFIGGDGYDTILGTSGADTLFLGDTNSGYYSGAEARIQGIEEIDLGAGDDVLDMNHPTYTSTDDIVAKGGEGNDILWTADGDDTIYGGTGNDKIYGDAGDDTVEGGAGSDTMNGGTGTDTLSYSESSSGVNVNLGTGAASGGDAAGDTFSNFENLTGSANADTLTGSSTANTINGGAGNDVIDAGAGNDIVQGGAGADTMNGGTGTDTLSYADSSAGVTVDMAAGTASGGDATDGWTVTLTTGTVHSDDGDTMSLSDDAAGTITLDDGTQIAFEGMERIEY